MTRIRLSTSAIVIKSNIHKSSRRPNHSLPHWYRVYEREKIDGCVRVRDMRVCAKCEFIYGRWFEASRVVGNNLIAATLNRKVSCVLMNRANGSHCVVNLLQLFDFSCIVFETIGKSPEVEFNGFSCSCTLFAILI